jgi:hypothetical protein
MRVEETGGIEFRDERGCVVSRKYDAEVLDQGM